MEPPVSPVSIDATSLWKRVTPPQRSEFDGRPRPFPSGAAPRPSKPGAMPIAHAPGFAVPSAVAVQEVAAVNVAVSLTMAAGVAFERRGDRHGS